jgi:uncharacterized protein YndB with AHSA1/START domain
MNVTAGKPTESPFVISRVFDSPRELVWKAWTERERMQWWGPKGIAIRHARPEFQVGGTFHYCIKTPEDREICSKWLIRETVLQERLVFMNSFSDAARRMTRLPMSPRWPLEMLSTVIFGVENDKTHLTINWLPLNATEVEQKAFQEGHKSIKNGWTGTLDRLDEHLAKA